MTAATVASALPGPSAPSVLRCRPGLEVADVDDGLGPPASTQETTSQASAAEQ